MKTATCPSPEQLSAYRQGTLPDERRRELADHVASCSSCRLHLEQTVSDPPQDQLQHTNVTVATLAPIAPSAGTLLAPPQGADEIGRLGGYVVRQKLGAGGMGVVYRAEDPQLRRPVALKVMNPATAQNPAALQRFLREARAVAALTHDHIVAIYQVSEDRGVLFLAMPLLQGEPLDQRLEREKKLPVAEVLRIGREAADGLAAAHERGLIHRDIKPANLWLEAPNGRVKILDFGLAREQNESEQLTQTGNLLGTPSFMSPEQARGKAVDPRSDLFSLGCVLYQLATGTSPFLRGSAFDTLLAVTEEEPPPLRKAAPELPPALAALIHQMLAKDPAARPATASEVVRRLRQIEEALTRRPRFVGVTALVLASLLTVASAGVAVALLNKHTPPPATTAPAVVELPVEKTKKLPPQTPYVDDAWVKKTLQLGPIRRYQAVEAKLRELNPEFKGDVRHTPIDREGKILMIGFITDGVTNISPLRALPELQTLHCSGSKPGEGTLSDLSPLQGLKLVHLECQWNKIVDYSPLKDMPLESIICDFEPNQDRELFSKFAKLKRLNREPAAPQLKPPQK